MIVDCINYFIIWFGWAASLSDSFFKLAEIFDRKFKSNWKVQASTLAINIGRPNVNKMDSCLVTGLIVGKCLSENSFVCFGTKLTKGD